MTQTDDFDTDLEQEVTDEAFDASGEEEIETPQKKKSGGGFLFKVIVLLVALGGGGFFLARSGLLPVTIPGVTPEKIQQAQQPLPVPVETKVAEPVQPAMPNEIPQSGAEAPSGMEMAESGMQSLPPVMDAGMPEMPMPVTGADPFADTFPEQKISETGVQELPGVDPFAETPAPAVLAQPEGTQEDVTGNAKIMAAEITPVMPVTTPEMTTENITAPPQVAATEVIALQSRIDSLEKRLVEMESRVATKADISTLEESINELQQSLKESATRKIDESSSVVSPVEKTVKKTVARTPEAAKPVAKEVLVPAGTQWVLRSAKPGMAWVSQKGSSEMRTVVVGDTLDGIGKITAIFKDSSGRWVVKGTKGSVNQ